MKNIIKLVVIAVSLVGTKSIISFVHYNFETLMDVGVYPKVVPYTRNILHYDGLSLLGLGQSLFEKYNPCVPCKRRDSIPKIIHQIWIGGDLPSVFKKYMCTWQALHPEWHYILWTDEKVKELFPLYNQRYYDESASMGVKSDLLKWEIVYRFGGVYVDVDFECLQPLDEIHGLYDFYTAFQPFDAFFIQLGAALFAAAPGHPILQHCIETIKDDWHEKGAPKKSGPVHFSKSFMAMAAHNGRRDIAFPAFYFYPLGSMQTEILRELWIKHGAYAVHHWAKSWMPKKCRRQEFKSFDNEQSSAVWND